MLVVPKGLCSTCSTPTGIPVVIIILYRSMHLLGVWICEAQDVLLGRMWGELDNQDGVRVGSSGYVNQSCANMQSGNGR